MPKDYWYEVGEHVRIVRNKTLAGQTGTIIRIDPGYAVAPEPFFPYHVLLDNVEQEIQVEYEDLEPMEEGEASKGEEI